MTAFLIGEAERAVMAAGQPVVVAPMGLPGLPLRILVPRQGVLRFLDAPAEETAVPLAPGLLPLAILAPDAAAAASLAQGLPAGVPQLVGGSPLPGLLALMAEALGAAEAARMRLQGRPGSRAPAPRQLVIDLPPSDGPAAPARVTQHLGRPAEALSGIALHVAAARATAASLLRARLLAGSRVVGAWNVPGQALSTGWIELDLPEPAPPGAAEAILDVALEAASGEVLHLSTAGPGAEAPLALRAETAEPGYLVLPRHFDWAARDQRAMAPGLALPVSESAWQAASIGGAQPRLVAAGGEPPRLLLDIAAGATALVALPPIPPGPADLALAELACRLGEADRVQVALRLGPDPAGGMRAGRRDSGWRIPDPLGALRIALPLPAGLQGALAMQIEIRNRGAAPVTMEVSMLALMAGAAGVPRWVPDAVRPAAPAQPPRTAAATRLSVLVPRQGPMQGPVPPEAPARAATPPAPSPQRAAAGLPGPPVPSNPPPPLAIADPGAPLPPEPPAPLPLTPPEPAAPATPAEMPPGGADFQDLHLHQYNSNADATYQHLDLSLTGLVSATGIWREVRLKLFERRGTVGLEFRRIKGWPPMFDVWPEGGADQYGPFWRLESQATAEALGRLAASNDRALVAALLDVLPVLARRASRLAGLPAEAQEAWSDRASTLARAVMAARPAPPPAIGRVG